MGWADGVAEVTLPLACSGETHVLRWSAGRIGAAAHGDLAAEEALAAFGAELAPCVDAVLAWRAAVADGGFLSEWSDVDLDDPVYRHHLRVAVNRLRIEGVQDVLRHLPPRRAEAMCRFLLQFPQPWVDRAALAVVRASRRYPPADARHGPVRRAVQVRARSSFVRSLLRWSSVVRPAALVRFECQVAPWGTAPDAAGVLDGTASWCRLTLSPQWLLDVWGPGRAISAQGDLTLGGDGTVLRWERADDGRYLARLG